MPKVDVPKEFLCPLTKAIMKDPVSTADGPTYERSAIEKWLKDHDTNPLTGAHLGNKNLTTNQLIKNQIEAFYKKNGICTQEVYWKAIKDGDEKAFDNLRYPPEYLELKDKDGRTPLSVAALEGRVVVIEALLKAGADREAKDEYGLTPLACAAIRDKVEATKSLLKAGADYEAKDKDGKTALAWAAEKGRAEVVEALLKAGADYKTRDKDDVTPLARAATAVGVKAIEALLKVGADREARDRYGRTPLAWAADRTWANVEGIQVLLKAGADREARDANGHTPLVHAVTSNQVQSVEALLKAGADREAKDKEGRTPLMWAARLPWRVAVVEALLKAKAEIEAAANNGNRALHHAVSVMFQAGGERDKRTIIALLNQGANPFARNNQGQTAVDLAVGFGYKDLAEVIQAHPSYKKGEKVWQDLSHSSSIPLVSKAKEDKEQNNPVAIATPPTPTDSTPSINLTVPRISWNALVMGSLIGNGSYGDVYQGQLHGLDVAVKLLQLKTLSPTATKEFEREVTAMMQAQSPWVAGLFGICAEAGHLALVIEYLPVSLRQRLQDDKPLSSSELWSIALSMAQGVAYLHGRGIIHRDLKSANILLKGDQAKITDFGLAKTRVEVASTTTKSHKVVGSVRWRAPELFKRNAVTTPAADVYSLGMLLWELVSRRLPFADESDEATIISWIKDGDLEKTPADCPEPLAEIINACRVAEPEERPSAKDVVSRLKLAHDKAMSEVRAKQQPDNGDEKETLKTMLNAINQLEKKMDKGHSQLSSQMSAGHEQTHAGQAFISSMVMELTSGTVVPLLESSASSVEANQAPASSSQPALPSQTPIPSDAARLLTKNSGIGIADPDVLAHGGISVVSAVHSNFPKRAS